MQAPAIKRKMRQASENASTARGWAIGKLDPPELAPSRKEPNARGCGRPGSIKNHGFPTIHQHPVVEVRLHGVGKHQLFEVTAFPDQV
jgi:hypothetical protein